MSQFDHIFKIVLAGDSGVGKSQLLTRYTNSTFEEGGKPTIGVEFATRITEMDDQKKVKAQIWDTAGQERYRAITNAYYRGALGAVLIYDVTEKTTFDNVTVWLKELRAHANRDIVLILVGNKIDLLENGKKKRQVPKEDAKRFADQFNLPWVETSAKSGINVDAAFQKVVKVIYEQVILQKPNLNKQSSVVNIDGTKSSKACCASS